jgi:hypothetical protein
MAVDDYAIVVGIETYPGLSKADGAKNDAEAFQAWLVDPAGGNVPKDQVTLVVTPAYGEPLPAVEEAEPTAMQVLLAAQALLKRGKNEGHVGRRLYLFFAGHGIAPREWETALLMANAEKGCMGSIYHWLGEYTAEHFRQTGYFDEILLFMDCCREIKPVEAPNMPWGPVRGSGFPAVKRFYAFATRWSELAWSRPTVEGGAHGEFTTALLEGFKRAEEPNSGGQITSASLKQYLLDRLPSLRESDFRADDLLVAQVEPATYPVTIHLPERTAGKEVQIRIARNGRFSVFRKAEAAPPAWHLALQKGLYEAQVLAAGLQAGFDVTGIGGVDVRFE